ncbi:MAG: GUN4 domain-containing protein [Prochloraceae cyanobacterium]|nr:GUN4 domain-containing protein [Prochloraceae cyanobacterium]
MSSKEWESEVNTRLAKIEEQLGKLAQTLAVSERFSQFEDNISRIESNLTLITDIDRYAKLRDLLVAQDFKQADLETASVLLEVAGHERDSLTPEDVKKFPCSVLRIIDRLWLTYSKERFGFSVQLQIYQSLGGTLDTVAAQDTKILTKFGDRVGWRQNNKWRRGEPEEWDFSLSAPAGSLPVAWWDSPYGAKMVNFFFGRLINCNL